MEEIKDGKKQLQSQKLSRIRILEISLAIMLVILSVIMFLIIR